VRNTATVKAGLIIQHVCRLMSTESCKTRNKKKQKGWKKKRRK